MGDCPSPEWIVQLTFFLWERCMSWDTALHHASQHERANFYFPDNATFANFSFTCPRAWRSLTRLRSNRQMKDCIPPICLGRQQIAQNLSFAFLGKPFTFISVRHICTCEPRV